MKTPEPAHHDRAKVANLADYRSPCSTPLQRLEGCGLGYEARDNGDYVFRQVPVARVAQLMLDLTRIRDSVMVQAVVTFQGWCNGVITELVSPHEPTGEHLWMMPFHIVQSTEAAAMLNAYDWMVSQGVYPAEGVVSVHDDGWISMDSAASIHDNIPQIAFDQTRHSPI